ncbi:hypothetical protein [Embleya sp. NPDC059237]|uniref:hypothetical protein n=1 Tax=Embleya sp. NPDC059237 TaxID=3346784 RepID=UPI00369234F3
MVVVRWLWRSDNRWLFRDRVELDIQAAVEALAYCERTHVYDAVPVLFNATSDLAGVGGTRPLDALISSELGQDHSQFARPDPSDIRFLSS